MAFWLSIVLCVFCTVRKVTNLQLCLKVNRKYVQYKPYGYYFVEDVLLLYSNKYFFFRSVINTVKI